MMSLEWIFNRVKREEVLSDLGYSADFRDAIGQRVDELAAEPEEKARFVDVARRYIEHGEIPAEPPANSYSRALLALTGYPQMLAEHQRRKVPFSVTKSTALDVERWVNAVNQGVGGIHAVPLPWILMPIRTGLLEIGRLQYVPRPFGYPYRVFKHHTTPDRIVALADAGIACARDGWPREGETAFETSFYEDSEGWTGYPVDLSSGRLQRDKVVLSKNEWISALEKNDFVLDVHIPAGGSLREDDCRASLREAKHIFAESYPEIFWKAFVCTSWLLDRELRYCLPPSSGIISFGSLFHPLATRKGSGHQIIERVLDNTKDWQTFLPRTSLQKAVVAHLQAGHSFRTTSGFLLRN